MKEEKQIDFNVLILATMSAGKTSFINALIGHEILYTANEATTSCITSIKYCRKTYPFSGAAYSYSGKEEFKSNNVSLQTFQEWNANSNVKSITISGRFNTKSKSLPGLILHDTPGPNNSQNTQHANLTEEAISKIPFDCICYLLNASQLATNDDKELLQQISLHLKNKPENPIYFILNKVDLLDHEKGEGIQEYTLKANQYLEGIGFKNPIIIPTMANAALYSRKALNNEKLTRSQSLKLKIASSDIDYYKKEIINATKHSGDIHKAIKKSLSRLEKLQWLSPPIFRLKEKNIYRQLIELSGIKTIEMILKKQQNKKYNNK